MGQPLYCSAANVGVWRERGYDGSTPYGGLSSIPLLPWLPGFPPQAFPPLSPPSHPLDPSLHTQHQPLPWDCSTIPKLELPASAPSRRPEFLPGGMYGCGKDCLILIPFRLPQISCFTLTLNCFSSDSDNCPNVGIGPLLQFPHPPRAGPVLLSLVFSSSSFLLPSFTWFYILFSTGQVLLSMLSLCSTCTSVSEGVS